jgi:hypothetical protein
MNTISITYATKYRLSFAHNYEWTESGDCFNSQTKIGVLVTVLKASSIL